MSTGIGHMWRHAPLWRMCVLASGGIFLLFMFFPPQPQATKKESTVQSQPQPQVQQQQGWQRAPAPVAPAPQTQSQEWRPPARMTMTPEQMAQAERDQAERIAREQEHFRKLLRNMDTLKPLPPKEEQKK